MCLRGPCFGVLQVNTLLTAAKPIVEIGMDFKTTLEGAARYAGLLLAPAEGFGRGLLLPFGQKKIFLCLFWPKIGNFW